MPPEWTKHAKHTFERTALIFNNYYTACLYISAYDVIDRTFWLMLLSSFLFTVVIGGLGFSTNQIGTALLSVAAPLLFLQMWTYPKVQSGLIKCRLSERPKQSSGSPLKVEDSLQNVLHGTVYETKKCSHHLLFITKSVKSDNPLN